MRLQLAAIPLATYRRLKDDLTVWSESLEPTHQIRVTPSKNRYLPIIEAPEIRDMEAAAQEGFVHILLVPTRWWRTASQHFRFDCRVAILDVSGDLRTLEWPALRAAMETCLEFEERWIHVVRPPDLRHPLLLPPPSFEPSRRIGDFWTACDVYRDTTRIGEAHDTLQRVISLHRNHESGIGPFWKDERNRRFCFDRNLHAMTPEERAGMRRFRFCLEVPRGFHFDVVHESGGRFCISDFRGNLHTVTRSNVDPWGRVR